MTTTDAPLSPQVTTDAAKATHRWRVVALVAGDALSFLLFAGIGRQSHQETSGLGAIGLVAATAFPFALGWYLVSPWLGAYRRRLTSGVLPMLRRTEIAWLCAWPVALVLRWAFSTDHQIPLSFAIVILVTNAVFLGVWRTVFAWATARVRW